jgi:hypothetical protein
VPVDDRQEFEAGRGYSDNRKDSEPCRGSTRLKSGQQHTEQRQDMTAKSNQQRDNIASEDGRKLKGSEQDSTHNEDPPKGSLDPATQRTEQVGQDDSPPEADRSSLKELERWSKAWKSGSARGASQISLPLSSTSVATLPPS